MGTPTALRQKINKKGCTSPGKPVIASNANLLFREVKRLINEARECEHEAGKLLEQELPPGTIITFLCGNMKSNANGEVVSTEVHCYPEVTVKNLFTGKTRRIPLNAIKGI